MPLAVIPDAAAAFGRRQQAFGLVHAHGGSGRARLAGQLLNCQLDFVVHAPHRTRAIARTMRVFTLIVIVQTQDEDPHEGTTSASAPSDPDDLSLRPLPRRRLGAARAGPRAAGTAWPGPGHLRQPLGLRRDRPGPDPAPAPGVPAGLGRPRLCAHRLPDLREVPGPSW